MGVGEQPISHFSVRDSEYKHMSKGGPTRGDNGEVAPCVSNSLVARKV